MKIEDQVVSLELAKELKVLGVLQDSVWFWIQQGEYIDDWSEAFLVSKKERAVHYNPTLDGDCSAYTVAELGEILPQTIDKHTLCIHKEDDQHWFIHYFNDYHRSEKGRATAKTEAGTRAKMLIYLIKEGLVKVENIK